MTTLPALTKPCVLGRELVAAWTMIGCPRRVHSAHVLGEGHRLQVIRIYAERVEAQMVNGQSLGNGSDKQFVGDAVSLFWLALWKETAIPASDCGRPVPARLGLFDLSPRSAH